MSRGLGDVYKRQDLYKDNDFQNWKKNWQERLKLNKNNPEKNINLMRTVNPLVIPRNNKVEKALEFAEKGDYSFLQSYYLILVFLANFFSSLENYYLYMTHYHSP